MDEEVVLLEEQLAAAHADIERLQASLGEAEARAAGHESDAAELRRHLDASREALTEREAALLSKEQEAASFSEAAAAAEERARLAAHRYRDAVLAREPELPEALVSGDSVDEIEESLVVARGTVAQVRQHLEQQAQALRVPAGAPPRGAPDLSSLTPAEKIRLGISQA